MKLSELIKQLQEIEALEGDIECYTYYNEDYARLTHARVVLGTCENVVIVVFETGKK